MSVTVDDPRASLAQDVRVRVPQPIDALETAAVIESMGVTDVVAREDYGASDSFDLAESIFGVVRPQGSQPAGSGLDVDARRVSARPGLRDTASRGVVALAPLAMLLGAVHTLAAAGLSTGAILALSFGISTGMILTSGPIMAIGRRTSIYLGFEYHASARRFATVWSLLTLLACTCFAAVAFGALSALDLGRERERVVFAGALLLYAVVWLLAAGLILVGATFHVIAALVAGLCAALGGGLVAGWPGGLALGYLATVLALAAGWNLAYRRDASRPLRLPWQLTLLEAGPYVAFGTAFALFLLVPHVIGWYGTGGGGLMQRLSSFELSLLVALPPLLISVIATERILGAFWEFAWDLGRGSGRTDFGRGITEYLRRGVTAFAVTIVSLSVATLALVQVIVAAGGLDGMSAVVFVCGLAAFSFVGVGQFLCIFMLGLALPARALPPLGAGGAVTLALGVPLSLVDYRLAAFGFAVGAVTFATTSVVVCKDVLEDAPHRYIAAF